MTSTSVLIRNQHGLHARPSAQIAEACLKFKSDIMLEKDGLKVSGKSILGVLGLNASHGTTITIFANGSDEEEAIAALEELIRDQLNEG